MMAEDSVISALTALSVIEKKNSDAQTEKDGKGKNKNDRHGKSTMECFYCKRKGHFARDCYKKKRNKQCESEKKNSENNAFTVTLPKTENNERQTPVSVQIKELMSMDIKDAWITDNHASCYLIYRQEWLIDFKR